MGTNSAKKAGHGHGHGFGCGKNWNKADAERLSHLLVIEKMLSEMVVAGYKGSRNVYVKVHCGGCGEVINSFCRRALTRCGY